MTEAQLRTFCLSLEGCHEEPHWEKTSFRVKSRILASYDTNTGIACLKLRPEQQDLFGLFDPSAVYPVPNAWGRKGYTNFVVSKVPDETLMDALRLAHANVK